MTCLKCFEWVYEKGCGLLDLTASDVKLGQLAAWSTRKYRYLRMKKSMNLKISIDEYDFAQLRIIFRYYTLQSFFLSACHCFCTQSKINVVMQYHLTYEPSRANPADVLVGWYGRLCHLQVGLLEARLRGQSLLQSLCRVLNIITMYNLSRSHKQAFSKWCREGEKKII